MSAHTAIAQVRTALVELYPSQQEAVRVVNDIGLNAGNINFQGAATNIWHSILTEANHHSRIKALLTLARNEYPTNAALATACEVFDQVIYGPNAGRLLATALEELAEQEPPDWLPQVGCPYRGLEVFTLDHASDYYGRERMVERIIEKLEQVNLVALVGPSGSGKSSMIRAGLLAALQRNALPNSATWQVEIFRPSQDPLRELMSKILKYTDPELDQLERTERAQTHAKRLLDEPFPIHKFLANVREDCPNFPRLFVVDQFEEIYTLCEDETIRQRFLETMHDAAQIDWLKIIFTLRADFYGVALQNSILGDIVDKGLVNVLPMTDDEYRLVIEEPARNAHRHFANGLVERILDDVHAQPGALPLLEFALTELWERQTTQGHMTHEAYDQIGMVQGAIAKRANDTYAKLDTTQQQDLRRIFTRLVRLANEDEAVEDTRRRVALTELNVEMQPLVHYLTDARLLVTDRDSENENDTVEVAHEALISNWERLREWLNTDREFLLWRQRLRQDVVIWEESGKNDDALLRGFRLEEAFKWGDTRRDELNGAEIAFIAESQALAARVRKDQEAAQLHLMNVLQTSATRRRQLNYALLTLLLLTIIAVAVYASQNRQLTAAGKYISEKADELSSANTQLEQTNGALERTNANLGIALNDAETERQRADRQARNAAQQAAVAQAGQLAAQSQLANTNQRDRQQSLPLVLALDAVRTTWLTNATVITQPFVTIPADRALRLAVDTAPPWRLTLPPIHHRQVIQNAVVDPSGQWLAVADDERSIHLWNLETSTHERVLWRMPESIRSLLFLHDSQQLLFGSGDNLIHVIDITSGKEIQTFTGHSNSVWSVALNADQTRLASTGPDGTVRLWDIASSAELAVYEGVDSGVPAVAFHPDGHLIAVSSANLVVILHGETLEAIATLEHEDRVQYVSFNSDGSQILSGTRRKSNRKADLCVWAVQDFTMINCQEAHDDNITMVNADPDGSRYVSSSEDGTAKVWDADSHALLYTINSHQGDINSARFTPDGQRLITAGADRTIQVHAADDGAILAGVGSHIAAIHKAIDSPDGALIASAGADGLVQLWDLRTNRLAHSWLAHGSVINDLLFTPDSQALVTAAADGTIALWSVTDGTQIRTMEGHRGAVVTMALTPDGTVLASGSTDRTARLWDLATGRELRIVHEHGAEVSAVAFNVDGTQIMTAGEDRIAYLWDMATGDALESFGGHVDAVVDAALSPDGTKVATLDKANNIQVWHIATGQRISRIPAPNIGINTITFGPDSQSILYATGAMGDAAMNDPQVAELIDLQGTLLMRLEGHTGPVNSARFSRDGQQIITASTDRTVRIWGTQLEGQTRRLDGHEGDVKEIAQFPSDPNLIAATGDDHTVRIWNIATTTQVAMFDGGHTDEVYIVVFNQDGTLMASGSDDDTIRVWEVATGRELHRLTGAQDKILALAFSPDGAQIASGGGDNIMRIWDLNTGTQQFQSPEHSDNINGIAYHPNGNSIAIGGEDGLLYLWDLVENSESVTFEGHVDGIEDLQFSQDGTWLVSGGEDGTVRIWSTADGTEIATFDGHSATVFAVAFNQDASKIVSASEDGTARIWNVTTGEAEAILEHDEALYGASFSNDGTMIATGSGDENVYLWDVTSASLIRTLKGHENAVNWVAFQPGSNLLATAANDNSVRLWDTATGEQMMLLVGHMDSINTVAVSPDGQWVLTGSDDKSAILWEVATRTPRFRLAIHEDDVNSVAFSPDGRLMATGSDDKTLRVWSIDTGELQLTFDTFEDDVNAVAFSPTDPWLIAADKTGRLQLWDLESGDLLQQSNDDQSAFNSIAFSPDGRRVVTGDDAELVMVWDVESLTILRIMDQHEDDVNAVDFSSDGKLLVSAAADNTVRIWDADSGQQLRVLEGHQREINAVAFNSDGSKVISGGDDFVLFLWDSRLEPLMARAEALIQRDQKTLTADERLRFLQGIE